MIKRSLILSVICILLSGCTYSYLESFLLSQEDQHKEETVDLPALLRDGWDFYLYKDNKVVLIKHTETGLLVKDVFGVLND